MKINVPIHKLSDPLYIIPDDGISVSPGRKFFQPYGQPYPYPELMLRQLVKWYKGRTKTFRDRCNTKLWNEAVKFVERLERAARRKP